MIFRCKQCGKFLFEVKSPDVITSIEVAKMFGKKHQHVMADIRRLNISNESSFRRITYTDLRNRKKPCYEMSRDGFRILAARYKATQLRLSPERPIKALETAEIKDSKQYTKIYGSDRIEVTCGRCGTVNVL